MSEDCLPPAARLVVAPSMRGATTSRNEPRAQWRPRATRVREEWP